MTQAALLNHLWQSTWFALACGAVAFALRRHQARLRFNVWLAASLKFLIPFAAFDTLRGLIPVKTAATAIAVKTALAASQPFSGIEYVQFAPGSDVPTSHPYYIALLALWLAGALALAVRWAWRARRVSIQTCEPGVRGIFRQRLVLPSNLEAKLSPAEFAAVLAHEQQHMRRHDNLWSALHMLAECVFWFHPFVWVIGAKLITERERACDEAVLEVQGNRTAYASAIISVCRQYLASPLPCTAGISGGSLTARIRRILDPSRTRALSRLQRLALAALALAAIAGPAIVLASQTASFRFDVVSIKPSAPGERGGGITPQPGNQTYVIQDAPLGLVISVAYQIRAAQISGGPAWVRSDRWDITAKADHPGTIEQLHLALQQMLADRFQLKLHHATQQAPVYELQVAPGGPKLTPHQPSNDPDTPLPSGDDANGEAHLHFVNMDMSTLGMMFSRQLGRPVLDQTGLTARYDFDLHFADLRTPPSPDGNAGTAAAPAPNPFSALFPALQQQLGLRLVSATGPSDQIVIDSVSKPTAN